MKGLGEQQAVDFGRYWNKHPIAAKLTPVVWILVIGGIAFLWNLGSTGLVDETEPLFAEAARQMTETGDWVTPYFNQETRFDKPPLIYWLMAIAYQTIGVHEWAVRLPSAISAIALMGMVFYTLRQFGAFTETQTVSRPHELTALIGSSLVALHPLTIAWARTGVSDMLLTGCIGIALMAFFCGYAAIEKSEGNAFRWYVVCYLFIALAILTKGPVGIVLPGLVIAAFLCYVGNFKSVLREMRPFWGLLIILAIALPWYALVTLANGEAFIHSFFGYHNIERFTEVVNRHRAPWYFYFVVVFLGFAPWSLYLPVAIARLQPWKRSIWKHQPRSAHLGLFAFFWFITIFLFFTIAVTKLPSYVLPLMPASAILVALWWSEHIIQVPPPAWEVRLSAACNGIFFLIVAGLLFYAPQLVQGDRALPNLATQLQQSGLPLLGAAIALSIAGAVLLLLWRQQTRWLWLTNTLGLLLLIGVVLLPASSIVDSQRQLPLRQLSQVIAQEKQPGEEIVMIGVKKPSVVFYSRQPVTFKLRSRSTLEYLREYASRQPEPATVLILSSPDKLTHLGLQPDQYQPLGEAVPYQLVRVSTRVITQLPERE
ncbi:glycosyltransferase family 39 protein [Leptothermofonsia sichuanensis E412]|uniref:ArnT family glycosyltransferase n=1 Tax=Leptothermofonsia sichuanensis TaxID=2917832 RepID=UPI001CA6B51D|nr:glycosyltransferase family 39 protein [Leptothermofonsia sichuanensis]QZZ22793.1 glycosyltransferase family 39 protein [Leptothermofonsia sichuanensis E412]